MAIQMINFSHQINVSIQPGDILYKTTPVSGQGGRNHPGTVSEYQNSKPTPFGVVTQVNHNTNEVFYDDNGYTSAGPTGGVDYIFFSKDNRANTSGIVGYYAKTTFVNDSSLPSEIFATAVDYVESSK